MKLLLGATIALLLGVLIMSWQGMNEGVKNATPEELARLQKQREYLERENRELDLQKKLQQIQVSTLPTTPAPTASAAEMDAMKAQLESQKAALAQIEADKAKRDAKQLAQDEEGLIDQRNLEKSDAELRRARLISIAMLVGRVKEYVKDDQYGGFITFDVVAHEQVQIGSIIGVRRKTGILAQFKVSDLTTDGGVANPLPGFGAAAQIKPGDELILPPDL